MLPQVAQLPDTLKTSLEAETEVVEMDGLVRVTIGDEVYSTPEPRNCLLEVAQLPKAPETSSERVAKVGQTRRFVRVTIRNEVNCIPVP